MGRRGPVPKPTAILKLAGAVDSRRRADDPLPVGIPDPPAWLTGRALEVWGSTVAILADCPGLLTVNDANALAAACIAQTEVERLYAHVEASGVVGEDGPNPYLKSLREWLEASSRLWAKFGCSPADRARNRDVDKGLPNVSPRGLAKFVNQG